MTKLFFLKHHKFLLLDTLCLQRIGIVLISLLFCRISNIRTNNIITHREELFSVYDLLDPSIVFGDLEKKIDIKEPITLLNNLNQEIFNFSIQFAEKYYPQRDGFGSSLELICDEDPTIDVSSVLTRLSRNHTNQLTLSILHFS